MDGEAILNFGSIDFGTYHFYPSAMGHANDFGDTWVSDHVAAGARANKPMIMEEYGLETAAARDQWYPQWLDSVRRHGGAGDLLWMVGSSQADVSGFRDTYTVLDASEVPAVAAHAREVQARAKSTGAVRGREAAHTLQVDHLSAGVLRALGACMGALEACETTPDAGAPVTA